MNRRIIAGKIELLQSQIDAKQTKAARIREKLTAPTSANAFSDVKTFQHDVRKRETLLLTGIDQANALDHEAAALQEELTALRGDLREALNKCDYKTRCIVRARLIYSCSWQECAELSGYCVRTCQQKFDRWLNA